MARTKEKESSIESVTFSTDEQSVTMTPEQLERLANNIKETINPLTGEVIESPSNIPEGYERYYTRVKTVYAKRLDEPKEYIIEKNGCEGFYTGLVGYWDVIDPKTGNAECFEPEKFRDKFDTDKKKLEDWNRAVAEEKG